MSARGRDTGESVPASQRHAHLSSPHREVWCPARRRSDCCSSSSVTIWRFGVSGRAKDTVRTTHTQGTGDRLTACCCPDREAGRLSAPEEKAGEVNPSENQGVRQRRPPTGDGRPGPAGRSQTARVSLLPDRPGRRETPAERRSRPDRVQTLIQHHWDPEFNSHLFSGALWRVSRATTTSAVALCLRVGRGWRTPPWPAFGSTGYSTAPSQR